MDYPITVPGVGLSAGKFTNGNPLASLAASLDPAEWANAVTDEILNVITQGGLTPIENTNTQLATAIKNMIRGGDYKDSVRFTTTANIVLSGLGTQAGGDWPAALTAGDRLLIKNQTAGAENGIWIAAAGAWTRAIDADTGAELNSGAIIPVESGTLNADSNWQLTTDGTVVIGTIGLTFLLLNSIAGLQGAFANLKANTNGISAVVTYTADEIVTGDNIGTYQSTRGWNSTITMTTLGTGGLDVGAVAASTWYYAYAINRPDGTKALISSLSSTSPSFANAAGYTKWARIGAFRTDATANKYPLKFVQAGTKIQYAPLAATNLTDLPVMASGTSVTWPTAIAVATFVPPTAQVIATVVYGNNIIGNTQSISYGMNIVRRNVYFTGENGGQGGQYSVSDCSVLESANVYWGGIATGGVNIYCAGFEDNF